MKKHENMRGSGERFEKGIGGKEKENVNQGGWEE